MMENEYVSSVRSKGDFGAVFECDGKTRYFYLFHIAPDGALKTISATNLDIFEPFNGLKELEIAWSANENLVYLKIKSEICATFVVKT
jgi:hypothetical protein